MQITEYFVEINPNATLNLTDSSGNLIENAATVDELRITIELLQKDYHEMFDSLLADL